MNIGSVWFGHWCAVGWLVIGIGICAGCGGSGGRVGVAGNVTLDGKPIEDGSIVFESADRSGPSAGGKIQQGTYSFAGDAGVMPGKKTVRIFGLRKTGKQVAGGVASDMSQMVDEIEQYVPAIYNEQSTLTCEVVAGYDNRHDFQLESK